MSDGVLPLSKFKYLCHHLATFHVQELNIIDLSNGLVSVTCVFAEGSLADGCSVGFKNEQNESWEHVIYKMLGKDSVNEVISIPNGIYHTVNVYDIVNGTTSDLISIDYTIELTVNISLIDITTSSIVETALASKLYIIIIILFISLYVLGYHVTSIQSTTNSSRSSTTYTVVNSPTGDKTTLTG